MRARYLILAALVVGVVGFMWWSNRPTLPPEQAVQARIDEALDASERRDVGALMDMVSDRFESDRFDRQRLRSMLFFEMQKSAWSKALIIDREIRATSDTRVEVSLAAVLARGGNVQSIEDIVPDAASAWHFDIVFELEDDTWRVVRLDADRARLRDLLP